jgi:enoyl-[acyl-carrier-protein] reductase (NADH)
MTELYQILGQVTYSYSRIDFLISSIAFDFGLTESPYIYFANSRFEEKLKAFNEGLSKQFEDMRVIQEIESWVTRLQDLRQKRNNLTHSIILSNTDNIEDMVFFNYRIEKKNVVRDVSRYTLTDLKQLNLDFVTAHNDGYTLFKKLKDAKRT